MYDPIGNLIADKQEEIHKINWNVYGKIKSIVRMASSLKKNLIFEYDANGNRIAKHQYGNMTPNSTTINFDPAIPTDWEKSTYYVLDAQGNVMAIYEYTIDDVTQDNHYTLTERNIYGSSRLGNNNAPVEMIATTPPNTSQYNHHIGYRQYELSNHLGNVLAVISDRKIARDIDQDNTVDYYEPDVLLTYDYSPFGAPLHARSFSKEVCDEVTSTQKIEDLNTDFTDGTAQGWTAMGNTSLTVNTSGQLKIEKNGGGQLMGATQSFMAISGELYDFTITIDKGSCNTNADILLEVLDANSTVIYTQTLSSGTQTYTTQFTASASGAYVITVQRINNAANCYFLIDDVLITHEEEVTQTLCEDFAGYRYGLMGYEVDNEIKGEGNSYDMGARMYDPRIGRTPSIDPAASLFPSDSPYMFAGNNPIFYIDEEGKWKVRFRDNNDHTAGIVLEAEPGDNLQTLATQMGIPYQELVDKNFGGKDFTLNAPLEGGEWLRQEDLPGVEAFQTTNNFLKGVTNENCNCVNLALGANGIPSTPFNEDSGFESVPQASELAREGESVSIKDAQFGDMITYKMTFESYIGYALSNGIQDYYKKSDGSLMTTEEIMPYIEAEYAKQKDMDHFSIFLLKDKTGTNIQQVLEKNGDSPMQISSGSGGADGQYTPASAKGDGGSSINRIK